MTLLLIERTINSTVRNSTCRSIVIRYSLEHKVHDDEPHKFLVFGGHLCCETCRLGWPHILKIAGQYEARARAVANKRNIVGSSNMKEGQKNASGEEWMQIYRCRKTFDDDVVRLERGDMIKSSALSETMLARDTTTK